jgi:hypothetical protein
MVSLLVEWPEVSRLMKEVSEMPRVLSIRHREDETRELGFSLQNDTATLRVGEEWQ